MYQVNHALLQKKVAFDKWVSERTEKEALLVKENEALRAELDKSKHKKEIDKKNEEIKKLKEKLKGK